MSGRVVIKLEHWQRTCSMALRGRMLTRTDDERALVPRNDCAFASPSLVLWLPCLEHVLNAFFRTISVPSFLISKRAQSLSNESLPGASDASSRTSVAWIVPPIGPLARLLSSMTTVAGFHREDVLLGSD